MKGILSPKVAHKDDIVSLYGDFWRYMRMGMIPASDCLPADLEDTGGRNLEKVVRAGRNFTRASEPDKRDKNNPHRLKNSMGAVS